MGVIDEGFCHKGHNGFGGFTIYNLRFQNWGRRRVVRVFGVWCVVCFPWRELLIMREVNARGLRALSEALVYAALLWRV